MSKIQKLAAAAVIMAALSLTFLYLVFGNFFTSELRKGETVIAVGEKNLTQIEKNKKVYRTKKLLIVSM